MFKCIIEYLKDNYKWILPSLIALIGLVLAYFIKPRSDSNKKLWQKIQDEIIDEAYLHDIRNGIANPGYIREEDFDKLLGFTGHIMRSLGKDDSPYFHFKWVPFFKINRVKRKLNKINKLRSDFHLQLRRYWKIEDKDDERIWQVNYNAMKGQERIDHNKQMACIMDEIISEYKKLSKMLS